MNERSANDVVSVKASDLEHQIDFRRGGVVAKRLHECRLPKEEMAVAKTGRDLMNQPVCLISAFSDNALIEVSQLLAEGGQCFAMLKYLRIEHAELGCSRKRMKPDESLLSLRFERKKLRKFDPGSRRAERTLDLKELLPS